MSDVPSREEVPAEHTWDLSRIFDSPDDWRDAYDDVADRLDELTAYEGETATDAATLLETLETRDDLMREVERVATYAQMRRDEDTSDQERQAMAARAESLVADAQSAASFVEPEVQELTTDEFESYVDEEPDLERYRQYVDDVLRMKPHTRSPEVEELLADFGEVTGTAGNVYSMLANADMTFPTVEDPDGEDVEITQSNFVNLLKRPDRDFRERVYEAYFEEWGDVRNTVSTAYAKSVTADVRMAEARNYETAREASLDDANVPVEVYDTLVDTVNDNLDALHRHAELKQAALDVDELRPWDLYMPLTGGEGPEIPYDEACEHVIEAVAPLGEDYQARLAEGLESRWVDVYENEGKRAGAYSGGTYDTEPFVLMNYQDDVASMYTLAHELGHSLHSDNTRTNQPYVYSNYELFVAEVASTVNEALLTEHLLETVEDPEFRVHILNEFLERVRSTLFRQTLFAEFEHRAHELEEAGEPLTADRFDELFGDLKARYYEPAVLDDHIAREWMRIPHFYRAFYVYQYSTGISAALALVDDIVADGDEAAADYLEFLRLGSREYPLDLLEIAGVDMRSPEPVERAIDRYADRLDELADIVD
ncbi:oligoendopeptidase F [Halovivax ruber XH-70]|uniref:Oligoendopeptidase F n=1 Tax=Halovivax ruber (strain DSM 18193 / JCM 13892 / XH-70) TaxID=797302 RepID=L0I917_HALRX|nr:oligoendopeptidase F [Halovivax ruber]AGB14736.1 oligoendopeptidase F [Halovivax ruber XH-70]